jgi:lipopolysaccharide/colanic/teichoic acid biosynthesis glycosyltransferase
MMMRLLDIGFALACLVIFSPLMLVIILAIRLGSPGPVLFRQPMVGKSGRPFTLMRFRTMIVDTAPDLAADQRFTCVGRFIRNNSIDHLPLLFNLLWGDLSIIGPRPMEPEFVNLADPDWQTYFQVKPGIFNYAVLKLGQEFGPSSADNLALKRRLEIENIQQRSFRLDLKFLGQIALAHIKTRGNIKMRGAPDPTVLSNLDDSTNS